jgi:hypothetical protein
MQSSGLFVWRAWVLSELQIPSLATSDLRLPKNDAVSGVEEAVESSSVAVSPLTGDVEGIVRFSSRAYNFSALSFLFALSILLRMMHSLSNHEEDFPTYLVKKPHGMMSDLLNPAVSISSTVPNCYLFFLVKLKYTPIQIGRPVFDGEPGERR